MSISGHRAVPTGDRSPTEGARSASGARRAAGLILAVVVALLTAVTVIGASLFPVLAPAVTKYGVQTYANAQAIGISEEKLLDVTEMVRSFVVDGEPTSLPLVVSGHPGFDGATVQHLEDVRNVISSTKIAVLVAFALLLVMGFVCSRVASARTLARALGTGGGIVLVVLAAVGIWAALNFDAFFMRFHALFFASGTWMFAPEALIIQCFPEKFWMFCGAVWLGGAVLLSAVALFIGFIGGKSRKPLSTKSAEM